MAVVQAEAAAGVGGGAPGALWPHQARSENRVVVSGKLTVPRGSMSLLDRSYTLKFSLHASLTNASFHGRSLNYFSRMDEFSNRNYCI